MGALLLAGWQARASLPRWMQNAISGSAIEAALYRVMALPSGGALYPRPPQEARKELDSLIAKQASETELYALRAREEEQALDFKAAVQDWQSYAERASDKVAAKLELADYYHRRLQSNEEISTLLDVGSTTTTPEEQFKERFTAPSEQRSWKAFDRILPLIEDQNLDKSLVENTYSAWIARYPRQPVLYAREFRWLLDQKRFKEAAALIPRYRKAFPADQIFPVKAAALVEYRQGSPDSVQKALAVYDAAFDPLWPPDLVASYYPLLKQTRSQRSYVAQAHAQLAANPDDLKAMTRLFYDQQQQGNLPAAQQVIGSYQASKEERKATWSAQELYTLAQLLEATHAYPEAARYDFALYHVQGSLTNGEQAEAEGLSGMIRILLTASNQSIALGAGNLSMYRDIATLDRGPGYWNGVLSLWLNSSSPEQEYQQEEERTKPYFNRAKATELIALLDSKYPKARGRAELHLQMIHALADYGESNAVIDQGNQFLLGFTADSDRSNRVAAAMLMADAYGRLKQTQQEFALYDRMLADIGAQAKGLPLSAAAASNHAVVVSPSSDSSNTSDTSNPSNPSSTSDTASTPAPGQSFEIEEALSGGYSGDPESQGYHAQDYQLMLDRYLGRLTATGQLPQALAVLRKEIDRNPNDPLLYEKLGTFLQQNRLSAQQEQVFEEAFHKFRDLTWYDRLGRLYLREKKREAFADLTRQVTDIFQGTELEGYFKKTGLISSQLFLQINLYAHQRFPHDEVFIHNLLQAYSSKGTRDDGAWETLLREHWSDSEQLRAQYFDYLSRNGKLDSELTRLKELTPTADQQKTNPAATRELAMADQWQSHFEESAPLLAGLAEEYPADQEIGTQASDVYRSLGYFDSKATDQAVQIETHLLAAYPANTERLARIGDIYASAGADAEPGQSRDMGHERMGAAAKYWHRIPQVHPGSAHGYLETATIFWDYFEFDEALKQIDDARSRFSKPSLFGYEAGAIEEGKRDFPAAIREYTQAAINPDSIAQSKTTETAAVNSDSPATLRLLQLARRAGTASTVDQATAAALEHSPGVAALELRERVLEVQKRSSEIRPLLESALAKAASFEQAQAIARQAQKQQLIPVYEMALQREIMLASDSVEKIELTYDLARSYEERKDIADASRLIDEEYRGYPKLLGVVRTTTDFYWRNKQTAKAIGTLVEASKVAQSPLKQSLLVEAATKANQAGSYAQARSLMTPLIDPAFQKEGVDIEASSGRFNPQYIAVVADSYALAGDNDGLKQFYLDRLAMIDGAHGLAPSRLTPADRKQTVALLRRGLIPALTHLKDYSGAVDQYIEIVHAYPEDTNASQEAALYALRWGRQDQLVQSVEKTVKDSPRDSRFAIVLGQVQTTLANYPAAVEAYRKAVAIRSDRQDVYTAKAELEERLQQLDEACQDYQRLYVLSYRNPDWMLKIAAVRARQGRKDEAVKALEQAWINGHPASAANYFRAATQLEQWRLLEDSLRFAQLGIKAEGDDLLAGSGPGNQNGDDPQGAAIYARLATRLRRQTMALEVLDAALKSADSSPDSPAIVVQQVEKQGLASVTDDQWRKQRVQLQKTTAAQRYRSALMAMGSTVGSYFTPEEKEQFAQLVESRAQSAGQDSAAAHTSDRGIDSSVAMVPIVLWIDVANAAGLAAEEAKLRQQVLLDHSSRPQARAQYQPFIDLERARMAYPELAKALGSYATTSIPSMRQSVIVAEADAYRDNGDEAQELRVLGSINYAREDNAYLRDRYMSLLLKRDPKRFASFGATSKQDPFALAAPNYAAAHGGLNLTQASIDTHANVFGPLWQNAYTALAGLYFHQQDGNNSSKTEAAFHALLDDQKTIGERIEMTRANSAAASKTEAQLATRLTGATWFYYGMRYGVFESLGGKTQADKAQTDKAQIAEGKHDPEAFLPAGIESDPSISERYADLAEAYAEAGSRAAALIEYHHALELTPQSPAIQDAMAVLLWQAGQHDAALGAWRTALSDLNQIQDQGPAPESFWSSFTSIITHVGSRKLMQRLHADIDAVLRNYIARNGNYRSSQLLEAVYKSDDSSDAGVSWILSLSTSAVDPSAVLADLDQSTWLPAKAREPILLRELELAERAAQRAGQNDMLTRDRLGQLRKTLLLYYAALKLDDKAEAQLNAMSAEQLKDGEVIKAQIELNARLGKLDELLANYHIAFRSIREGISIPDVEPSSSAGRSSPSQSSAVPDLQLLRAAAQQLSSDARKKDALAVWQFVFDMGEMNRDLMPSDYLGLAEAHLQLDPSGGPKQAVALLRRMTLEPGDVYANYDHAATLLEQYALPSEATEFLAVLVKDVPWESRYAIRLSKARLGAGKDAAQAVAALEVIASNSDAGYAERAQAATILGEQQGPHRMPVAKASSANYGSGELNLIAGGKITPAQAQRPYFVWSRELVAATQPDAAQRASLLREALAIDPFIDSGGSKSAAASTLHGNTLRFHVFQAEAAAGHMATALVAVQPLFSESPASYNGAQNNSEAAQPDLPEQALEGDSEASVPLPAELPHTNKDKLVFAFQMAQIYETTDDPAQALPYLHLALLLKRDAKSAERVDIEHQIEKINIQIALEARNRSRRPTIQRGLEQSVLVKPILTAAELARTESSSEEKP